MLDRREALPRGLRVGGPRPLDGHEIDVRALNPLVDSVRDYAIFRTDPAGTVTTWNEGVRSVLGFSEAEFVGTDSRRLFTPEDRAAGVPEREMRDAA